MGDMSDLFATFDEQIKNFGTAGAKPSVAPAAPAGALPSDHPFAQMNRASRVAQFGESTVAAMEAAGARPPNMAMPNLVGATPPPPPVVPETPPMPEGGFGAKASGMGKSLLKGAGALAGVAGSVLSAEDIAKNGVGVGNSLGLASGVAGTAASVGVPLAGPAALLTAAPLVGYGIGQNLPDAFTTRLASLAGRFGFGAKFAGANADAAPSIMGPEATKFMEARAAGGAKPAANPATIDGVTGQVLPDTSFSDRNLGVPPPAAVATPAVRYATPGGGVENGYVSKNQFDTPGFFPANQPVGVTGAQAPIGPNAVGLPEGAVRNNTVQRTVDANGNPVYTNFGAAENAQAPVRAGAGYGARSQHTAAQINPATGLPYSSTITPVLPRNATAQDVMDYMANATRYVPAAAKEKQLLTQKIAERNVTVQSMKEAGADRRLMLQEMGKPVTLTDAGGKQVAFHPLTNKFYGFDKDGKPTVGDVTAGVPPYSSANAKAMVAKLKAANPKAGQMEIRNRLKQYWPDADISNSDLQ